MLEAWRPETIDVTNTAAIASIKVSNLIGTTADAAILNISDDGTKMYVTTDAGDEVYSIDLGTPWDITSWQPQLIDSTTTPAQLSISCDQIVFGDNGNKLYAITDVTTDRVFQFTLATPYSIGTASYDFELDVNSLGVTMDLNLGGIVLNSNGTRMILCDTTNGLLAQYTLSQAWNVATASYDSVTMNQTQVLDDGVDANADFGKNMHAGDNNTKLFFLQDSTEEIEEYLVGGLPTITLPAATESPPIPLRIKEKTALSIITNDGGTSYQIINAQEKIS